MSGSGKEVNDRNGIVPWEIPCNYLLHKSMTKYDILKEALEKQGRGEMKAFGNSMLPLIESGSLLTFERRKTYSDGDIVLSRVRGRWIDAHKIVAVDARRGFLIANNHGYQNGWTHQVFGKVVRAVFPGGTVRNFA